MQPESVIVPSRDADFTFLSRTPTGRLFKKHILNMGTLYHPVTGEPVEIDDAFVSTLKQNFENKVCDIVQIPLAGPNNEHTEAPDRNIGEIVDIQKENGKVYAFLDARDEVAASKLGKTLLGASAMMHLNYTDTRTNQKVGPTLLHVCVTNRPHVVDLEDYKEIVAATADTTGEVVFLTDKVEKEMTKEELLAMLKAEHGVDVAALEAEAGKSSTQEQKITELETKVADGEKDKTDLQAKVAEGEKVAASVTTLLSNLKEAGVIKLTGESPKAEDITNEDVSNAIVELSQTNTALNDRIGKLELTNAQAEVDALVKDGKVIPAQRDVYVDLRMTNVDMFNKLVPDKPIVKMTNEAGVLPDEHEQRKTIDDAEIARLSALYEAEHGMKK